MKVEYHVHSVPAILPKHCGTVLRVIGSEIGSEDANGEQEVSKTSVDRSIRSTPAIIKDLLDKLS